MGITNRGALFIMTGRAWENGEQQQQQIGRHDGAS